MGSAVFHGGVRFLRRFLSATTALVIDDGVYGVRKLGIAPLIKATDHSLNSEGHFSIEMGIRASLVGGVASGTANGYPRNAEPPTSGMTTNENPKYRAHPFPVVRIRQDLAVCVIANEVRTGDPMAIKEQEWLRVCFISGLFYPSACWTASFRNVELLSSFKPILAAIFWPASRNCMIRPLAAETKIHLATARLSRPSWNSRCISIVIDWIGVGLQTRRMLEETRRLGPNHSLNSNRAMACTVIIAGKAGGLALGAAFSVFE